MCSIGEEDFGDDGGVHAMIPAAEPKTDDESIELGVCKKCAVEDKVFRASNREPECGACYVATIRHKFRATLGASKVLPRNSQVLIVFDGSKEAVALLDMVTNACAQTNFKRLHCTPSVLYIDDVCNSNVQKVVAYLQQYRNSCVSYIMPLGDELQKPYKCADFQFEEYLNTSSYVAKQKLLRELQAIESLTARQDYLRLHRKHIIAAAAKQLDCAYAFLSEINLTLATEMLSAIVLGRGDSVAHDVALADERLQHVKLLRPIKDITRQEIELYLRALNLSAFEYESFVDAERMGSSASLQNMIKSFMHNLANTYPATVATVYRTSEKIAATTQSNKSKQKTAQPANDNEMQAAAHVARICDCCKSPMECERSADDTLIAIEYSRLVSSLAGLALTDDRNINMGKQARTTACDSAKLSGLCYACRKIQDERHKEALKS